MDQSDLRAPQHEAHGVVHAGAYAAQLATAMHACVMVTRDVEFVVMRQPTDFRKGSRELLDQLPPEFHDVESPFFRSIS